MLSELSTSSQLKGLCHENQCGLGLLRGGYRSVSVSQTSAETVQTGANVFNGRPFLWLEAESFGSITDGGAAGNGWKVVSKESPINSNQGVPILPSHFQCFWNRTAG